MIGAEKVMTMTSTYDHRDHPGRRVGPLPAARSRRCLQGDDGFYENVFADARRRAARAPAAAGPAAAAAAARAAIGDARNGE